MIAVAVALATPVVAQGSQLLPRGRNATPSTTDRVAGAAAQTPPLDTRELVVNGGFENGVTGWRVNDTRSQKLISTPGGRSGAGSATVTAATAGTVVLNDATNTVTSTVAGTTFQVSAYVRGSRPGLSAMVRVREVRAGQLVDSGGALAQLTTGWQQVSFTHVTRSAGGHLDLNVVGWKLPAGTSVVVDDVSMRRVAQAPATPGAGGATSPGGSPSAGPSATAPSPPGTGGAPATTGGATTGGATTGGATSGSATGTTGGTTTSAGTAGGGTSVGTTPGTTTRSSGTQAGGPTPSVGTGEDSCVDRRGIPDCGTFLGAAVGGNTDPASKEASFGSRLALRRTYYQAGQVSAAVRTARSDLAVGRLPWISFKLPHSWTDMANGKGDAWAKNLASQLSQVGGPVWLALHHEPENDGTMSEWVRMQAHLSPIIRTAAPNVAYTIVLTGWNQVFGTNPAYSFEATWPGDGLVDIIAIDPYNEYGAVKNGKMITKSVELKEYYAPLAAFAAKHGTRWAVAETGYTDLQASRDPAWLNRAYADMRAMGGVGLAYFDSPLNSVANWQLTTPDKIGAFSSALRSSNRLAP